MSSICNKLKNLMDLSYEETIKFMDSFDYIFLDYDGTISGFMGNPIKDSMLAIKKLQEYGKQIVIVSNNSLKSENAFIEPFLKNDIYITKNDLIYPTISAIHYLKQVKFEGLIYIIGSKEADKMFRNAGFDVVEDSEQAIDDSDFSEVWKIIDDNKQVRAVFIDATMTASWSKLARAEIYLKDPKCLFIVGATDKTTPVGKFSILGSSYFYRIIEEMSGRKPTVLGKPGDGLSEIIIDKYNIKDTNRALFVGDMITQDIGFGNKCGFQTLLVLSGGTSKDTMCAHKNKNEMPDFYTEKLGDFVKILDDLIASNNV